MLRQQRPRNGNTGAPSDVSRFADGLDPGPGLDQIARNIVLADCRFNVEVHNGRIYYSNAQGIFELPPGAVAQLPAAQP